MVQDIENLQLQDIFPSGFLFLHIIFAILNFGSIQDGKNFPSLKKVGKTISFPALQSTLWCKVPISAQD